MAFFEDIVAIRHDLICPSIMIKKTTTCRADKRSAIHHKRNGTVTLADGAITYPPYESAACLIGIISLMLNSYISFLSTVSSHTNRIFLLLVGTGNI